MRKNARKAFDGLLMFAIIAALAGGLYLLLIALAPTLPASPIFGMHAPDVQASIGEARGNRLYIPKIDIDIAIVQGADESVLEKGAWHRHPHRGNPEMGGNFVLSAHRFVMGWTPQQTRAKSPFYHIDKLEAGDELIVVYDDKYYTYIVSRLYDVPPTATEIEAPSEEAKLTLYSCDLRGASAGRVVVEARPQ